jgi:hypothetical protein
MKKRKDLNQRKTGRQYLAPNDDFEKIKAS